ncbi:MAG TPA: hypothetical protein VF120_12670 [Ktedonobacterales bacterium]
MRERVRPVGAILKEWRHDKGQAILDFAVELEMGGLTGDLEEIMRFLVDLETREEWSRDYNSDSFDELLDALNRCVRRAGVDDLRWQNLYLAFTPHRKVLIFA